MKTGKTLQELALEVERQKETKVDLVADTRHMAMGEQAKKIAIGSTSANARLFEIGETAHEQIGARLGIPTKYYERMRTAAPDLLAANVNRWFQDDPHRRMVRTLDGKIRAFLSDRFQRIDNFDVLHTVMPIFAAEAAENGLEVVSCDVTERRMYLKAVSPKVRGEVTKGDVVQAGVEITNSEIGAGAFVVSPLVYRLVCLNGMTLPDARFRRTHVGARAEKTDALYDVLSEETLKKDDEVILLKARDVVKAVFEQTFFNGLVRRLQDATEQKVEGDVPKAVEVLGKTIGLNGDEESAVLRHLIEGGDLSRYGVLNAVTRTANDAPSYDRASELETLGGKVLDLKPSEWNAIAAAA